MVNLLFQKVEGIVIRTTDYGETNKIITLYTRELGKVGVMARGAKKPKSRLSSISQPFTYGYYLIQKSTGLGTLQQGEIIYSMRKIREDIFCTAYAAYVVELTDKVVEDKKVNPHLFELLLQTLKYMSEGIDLDILLNIYEMKMLSVAGIHPIIDGCSICGKKEEIMAFSIREGGYICSRCVEKDPHALVISSSTIKLLRLFYYFDINRLGSISVSEQTKAELRLVLSAYYDEYSGIHLKSRRFLEQMKKNFM